ncbi:MAG TPA: metallopeptidase TldD-related protein [Bryobacteraceae bacterium]|jgi:predicted Zn-dependent protease
MKRVLEGGLQPARGIQPRKYFFSLLLSLLLFIVPIATASDTGNDFHADTQLRAMADELARSRTLRLNNLDKPYFVQYSTSDADQLSIQASLGGLISSDRTHFRAPQIEVRIGDYKFDNTNSVFSRNVRIRAFPIDDDYHALRTAFWLSTDSLYKLATDQITRKRNVIRELSDPDRTPDFAIAKPEHVLQPVASPKLEQKQWEAKARELSGRFAGHPEVITSTVAVRLITSTYRMMNTEGTAIRIPQDMGQVEIRAAAMAPDGSRVWNHRFITALRASDLPGEPALQKAVDEVAGETEALAKAPLATDYSGPVLFVHEAAAQLMAQVLTNAVTLDRRPVAPPESNPPRIIESVWSSRLASKVAPDWLSIWDDPAAQQFDGTALAGAYEIDDEGVPAQRVLLVDNGTLKGFLFSREPVRNFNSSNGHGRLPGAYASEQAAFGNLFIHASGVVPEDTLKAKLLEKVKANGLKFGLIIRRIDFPSTAGVEELQSLIRQLQKTGYVRSLNAPLLVYRAYPDGREELVRGLRFTEFSAKDLRDVTAAADDPYVLNYVNNGSAINHADAGADATTSSVICPSLLFDNVELARAENEAGRAPLVPPPALTQ